MKLEEIRLVAYEKATNAWFEQNPALAMRGIDESRWNALCSSIYPGAKLDSILMAVDYCRARGLDVMLKPVHLVPMSVKNAQTGHYEWRDVPMPGVGLYRIQANRTGDYAGADAPEMGPEITKTFTDKNKNPVAVTFPEWCKYTVYKLIGDRLVSYTALEYWEENYATDSKNSTAPNAMWMKRRCAQLAKCTEAQALRKGWPEIGQEPTAEEMEGKILGPSEKTERDVGGTPHQTPDHGVISDDQKAILIAAAAAAGKDEEYICSKAKVASLDDLASSRFDPALNHLNQLPKVYQHEEAINV
jgi:phage recombination protein Bet